MNRIVDSWKVAKEDELPDGLTIDGVHFKMAERKKPETEPQLSKDELKHQSSTNADRTATHLSKKHFNNVIRYIKLTNIDTVKQIRTETWNNLKRLQVKRDLSKAPSGVPKGSDQVDVGTLVSFLRGIEKTHEKAVQQLLAIDAACQSRFV